MEIRVYGIIFLQPSFSRSTKNRVRKMQIRGTSHLCTSYSKKWLLKIILSPSWRIRELMMILGSKTPPEIIVAEEGIRRKKEKNWAELPREWAEPRAVACMWQRRRKWDPCQDKEEIKMVFFMPENKNDFFLSLFYSTNRGKRKKGHAHITEIENRNYHIYTSALTRANMFSFH